MSQPEHEYIKRLARAFEKGVKFKRSDINNIEVGHDDGSSKKKCGIFLGRHCDCDPHILCVIDGRTHEILENGDIKECSP